MENLSNLFYRSIKKRREKKTFLKFQRYWKKIRTIESCSINSIRNWKHWTRYSAPVCRSSKKRKERRNSKISNIHIYMYRKTQSVLGSEEKFKILLGKRIDNRQQLHQRVIISDRIYTYIYIFRKMGSRKVCQRVAICRALHISLVRARD